MLPSLVKRKRESRLDCITKPRARKFRFNRAHPCYFYPLIVERIAKRETPNALKYLFPLILTHRDFSWFGQKIAFSLPRKKHREACLLHALFLFSWCIASARPCKCFSSFSSTLLPLFTSFNRRIEMHENAEQLYFKCNSRIYAWKKISRLIEWEKQILDWGPSFISTFIFPPREELGDLEQ